MNPESITKITRMVEKYASKGPYHLHPDKDKVRSIIEGLAVNLERYGRPYCPCMPVEKCIKAGIRHVCPCEQHKEDIARQGYCDCALFVRKEFLNTYTQIERF
ncbi:MAG: ferredoxin:thioredoxin reductase [Nitrospirae bacterium]|nr:ferredoxin:thioredoxin reductase [Nitrospirota bacterium]